MCTVDWGFIAAWVGALATVGLLISAVVGFGIWKKQFFKQRDHDLAMRIIRSVLRVYDQVSQMRSPIGLITDGDVSIPASGLPNPEEDRQYRTMWARYRARTINLQRCVTIRASELNEAIVVWDETSDLLKELAGQLEDMENALSREVFTNLEALKPTVEGDIDHPDIDVLYAPVDVDAVDQFSVNYREIISQIRSCVGPKIRME